MDAQQASTELDIHLQNALVTQEKQDAVSRSMDGVSLAVTDLIVQARSGIEELNGTVSDMTASARTNARDSWMAVMWPWLSGIVTSFLRGALYAYVR